MLLRSAPLLALLLPLTACNGTQASSPPAVPAVFDEERAWKDLEFLCEEIGPRRIGTPGAQATRAWLQEELGKLDGWTVEIDDFTCEPPEGARRKGEIQGANVIARRRGTVEGELWICSHYDTFDKPNFVGANDAGSSTVVLLEFARQLAGEEKREGMDIVLVWFDGEEPFPPAPWHDDTNSTFGSRHAVAQLQEEGNEDARAAVRAMILLDMVGDKDLNISIESSSDRRLKAIFERTAFELGDKKLFGAPKPIKDDHIHFRDARIPACDLIDFSFGPGNSYWHTLEDTLDKCSAESLGRVGRLVLSALPALEAEFGGER